MDLTKPDKNPTGRPTKYRPEYNKQAYKLGLLGATDKQLAEFFEVDEATINRWKVEHEGFCKSLKAAKGDADGKVAESLYKRALGYSHPEDKVFIYYGKPVVVKTIKHHPPDTVAAIFWLKNRAKEVWREKQVWEFERLPDDQLDTLINKLKASANESKNPYGKNRSS